MDRSRIMLVEPAPSTREAMIETLESLGCEVFALEDAESALEAFVPGRFPVIVTNAELPRLDGIDLVDRIVAKDPSCVPIVVTPRTDQKIAIRALEAGVRHFLTIPFAPDALRLRIEDALAENSVSIANRLKMGELIRIKRDLSRTVAERERHLGRLINAAPFAIVSTGRDGRIATFNTSAMALYGYDREEIVGRGTDVLGPFPHEEEGQAVHRTRQGDRLPVYIRSRDVANERGDVVGEIHTIEDLTEKDQLESQLLHAERLSLLGQMAPRIAHELKGPLQVIIGNAELGTMRLEGSDTPRALESIKAIIPAAHQILDMIQQMSNLGKPAEQEVIALDVGSEIRRLIDSLRPLGALRFCEVTFDEVGELPCVMADRSQLDQAFRNLIINAAHAMDEQDKPCLTIQIRSDGNVLQTTISDTGCGMPAEILDQIFQPFFTTKPEDKGTGLGLPIVRTVVDRLGGTIGVESKVGVGTTFTVSLPACQRSEDDHLAGRT